MIDAAVQVVVVAACIIIFVRSEPTINRMTRQTALTLRVSMHFLTVGSAWQIGAIVLLGDVPHVSTVIVIVGAASLLVCDRRLRAITGRMGRRRQDGVTQ